MDDLIIRQALIATFEKIAKEDGNNYFHLDEITQEIFDAPSVDAVEVVRCKDCLFNDIDEDGWYLCKCFGGLYQPDEDDFCSYGKRREDNAN